MTALTFSDVLIVPKYSEVLSRKDVDISSDFGDFNLVLPVISANMKSITGPDMAFEMSREGGLGILHRFNTIDQAASDYMEVINNPETTHCDQICGVSVGVQDEDRGRFDKLYGAGARIFVIDIAHGHCASMQDMVKWMKRRSQGTAYIIGGNIATGEAAYELADWGCNCIKVGIGPGCFVAGTKVNTDSGYKKIEDIKIDDKVLTHRGQYKRVVQITNRKEKKEIYSVNGQKCTGNHEFYVIHKKYSKIVNDDNIEEYAEWISAEKMTKDYLLLKVKK